MHNIEIKSWLLQEKYSEPSTSLKELIKEKVNESKDHGTSLGVHSFSNISKIIYLFSQNPWLKQSEISKILSIDKKNLIELNKIISNSKYFQNLITQEGISKKYWQTIFPFTVRLESALENKFSHPMRIALYPGVSCMFYCGFCGRNQKEKYPLSSVDSGNDNFKKILEELDAANSAISISGGLEPLTNPKLGDIINFASNIGLRVPLITNAYSLTPDYVQKNLGLFKLDSLRVSLYGVDEDSYTFITRLNKSYKMVKKNVINFIKQRNEINPKLKVGFNFIILKENIRDILKVLNLIEDINSSITNGEGINFLSLRDDFDTVTGISDKADEKRMYHLEGLINQEDKKELILLFKEIENKRKKFNSLHIDYGYALYALKEGIIGSSLRKVTTKGMRQYGHTQMSVCIDLFGDVFLYREAGFLNRVGNEKFIIGRVDRNNSLKKIINDFINSNGVNNTENDVRFMDPFDHVLTSLINQAEDDKRFGIPFNKGPIKNRAGTKKIELGNNWYSDSV